MITMAIQKVVNEAGKAAVKEAVTIKDTEEMMVVAKAMQAMVYIWW